MVFWMASGGNRPVRTGSSSTHLSFALAFAMNLSHSSAESIDHPVPLREFLDRYAEYLQCIDLCGGALNSRTARLRQDTNSQLPVVARYTCSPVGIPDSAKSRVTIARESRSVSKPRPQSFNFGRNCLNRSSVSCVHLSCSGSSGCGGSTQADGGFVSHSAFGVVTGKAEFDPVGEVKPTFEVFA
jgi:hypothetical protein